MRIFWLAIVFPPVELVHTLPGVLFVFSFDGRSSLVVRLADWSPEITGGGHRRNLPVHPLRAMGANYPQHNSSIILHVPGANQMFYLDLMLFLR